MSFVRSIVRSWVRDRSAVVVLRETKVFLEFPFLYLDIFYVLLTAGARDKKRTVSSSSHSLLTSFTSLSLSLLLLRFTLKTRKHADAVHG